MRRMAEAAAAQRADLLDRGGYMAIPNDMLRKQLPFLVQRYGKDGSDAVLLWTYLRSYANGDRDSDAWLWSYPSREQIICDTGIGKNRLSRIIGILEAEGLLITTLVSRPGKPKKRFFLTLL